MHAVADALPAAGLSVGLACGKSSSRPPAAISSVPELSLGSGSPLGLDRGRLNTAPLTELAFVPQDAQAVVRVDLGALATRTPQVVKTFDFVLRAQQPGAWQVLHQAGLTAGKEISILYLVVSPTAIGEPYLVAGMGHFDTTQLGDILRRSNPQIETAVASPGSGSTGTPMTTTIYTWTNPGSAALGATEAADEGHDAQAAIGIADGFIVCVRSASRAFPCRLRAGRRAIVRRVSALADELVAVDTSASAWGAAAVKIPSPLEISGLEHGHFSTTLASPGPDLDGILELSADFASEPDAQAFAAKLEQILAMVATVSGSSPLGPVFAKLHSAAHIHVEGARVTASSVL